MNFELRTTKFELTAVALASALLCVVTLGRTTGARSQQAARARPGAGA